VYRQKPNYEDSLRISEHGLSASAIKSYIMCNFKYFLEYQLGIRKGDTWATKNGTIIHAVIENFANGHIKNWRRELLWRYKKAKPWELHKEYKVHATNCPGCTLLSLLDKYHGDLYNDVKKANALDKLDKVCPLREVVAGWDLVQGILDRNDKPLEMKVIDAEKKFTIQLADDVTITGYIDLVCEVDEETIEIRDWKTGKWMPTYDECLIDPQLRIYDYAASILYPQYKCRILTFDYIRNKPFTFVISDADREKNREWLIKIAREIQSNMNPSRKITYKCKSFCSLDVCNVEYPQRLITIKKPKKAKEEVKDETVEKDI
jgi:hypothetical protein